MEIQKQITIKNRRATFDYSILEKYIAGMVLLGSEIKSIRLGKANLSDSFCGFFNEELFVRALEISEWTTGAHYNNHIPKRDRKLLLTRNELKKLTNKLKDKGLTLIPLTLFINERGFAKLEFALAKGKKLYDKREDIKDREAKREISRKFKK
jgi:SsrA-binding protein